MRVCRLTIKNFRGIAEAILHFNGHTLLIGGNNVGKSTVCEALDLVLGPERLNRLAPIEEFDFRNANYLAEDGETPVPLWIEVVLTDLTQEVRTLCASNTEFWNAAQQRLLEQGELADVDMEQNDFCLRLLTVGSYDVDDDRFVAKTYFASQFEASPDDAKAISDKIKRAIGFLYLRTIRTGSRALSLERGTLLDNILRMKEARKGMWEAIRKRLADLAPPIDTDATELGPILEEIEDRLAEYIAPGGEGRSTRLFVSQLTREHLRKTIAFFLAMGNGEQAIPFQQTGTGTLNTLVLALLTFIAELKKDNVIFAMEEPEIALPPHTQRRIANYLLKETAQCFVTSHSPYVIERFEPDGIVKLQHDDYGKLVGIPIKLPPAMKAKNYRTNFRRAIAEAMLGQAVIVGEGLTEQEALLVVAQKLEDGDDSLFPLDVAGISVINAEGDGNLEKLGAFFKEIGVPAFAFFDRKKRKQEEVDALAQVFVVANEIKEKGAEGLLSNETPLERQWAYLETVRSADEGGSFGIPQQRPDDASLRDLTSRTLKGQKGDGGAARLLALCSIAELPSTMTTFLLDIYNRYPKPKRKAKPAVQVAEAPPPTTAT